MRSLFSKITLAFIVVSLVGAGLAAIIVQQRTRTAFDRFLFDQNIEQVVAILSIYYQSTSSWEGVSSVIQQIPIGRPDVNDFVPHGDLPGNPGDQFRFPYVLVDADGRLVYGITPNNQQSFSKSELKRGMQIVLNGETIGWLLSARDLAEWERDSPQGTFLTTVSQAIIFSAIGAIMVSLILGAVLARSLTNPLRELAAATRKVAQGVLGYQVVIHSKDEIGQLAESFNLMSADLDKSSRLRKQMTADIAHDLRNPLSILLGYTEALSDGKLEGTLEMYETMHTSAGQLSRLVDDLRTLSLADAGELPIQCQRVGPVTLLEQARAAYASLAEARGVALQVQAAEDLPQVEVDPERMAQVFANLVTNALRYTPAGGQIELSAWSETGSVLLAVRDNGSGIAPEDLPHVFDRFYRGDKSRVNNGDAGLGLSIAKSLVTAMGGEISVESKPGEGATFTIKLPGI